MKRKMNIVMIASECVPYAKTGGLADVVGALPIALKKLGHQVSIIMPKYAMIDSDKFNLKPFLSPMGVWMGNAEEWCSVLTTPLAEDIPVYFIEFDKCFGRDGLYHDAEMNDYLDNPDRFAFLSRAGLQLCRDIHLKPDIIHTHDWHTALAAAYLKIWHWNDRFLGNAASVLTIHNIGYQGKYPAESYDYLGLQWGNFKSHIFEDHGNMNLLKGGIHFSDAVTTVSPTYAQETRGPIGGMGLAPYLNDKGENYQGILNGVDYTQWDPEIDPLIPENFSPRDLSGKKVCKQKLQKRLLLEDDPDIPLIGIVSRFADQKGLDLLAEVIEGVVNDMVVQFAILGSGDKELEDYFGHLPAVYPGRVGCFIGYDNELAHWIEAGSDFFVMPSRYEPCGLNQIYSLKYGTLPIVRAVGGLDDTVEQYDEKSGTGTGFKFQDATGTAVYYSIGWAVSTYYDRREHILKMMQQAMAEQYTWEASARAYEQIYLRALENKQTLG